MAIFPLKKCTFSYPSLFSPKFENVSLALLPKNFVRREHRHKTNCLYKKFFSMTQRLFTIYLLRTDCQLVSDEGCRQLHSANSRTCVVIRTCSSYGDRCFAAAGRRLWNSLLAHLRQTDINFEQFKRQLKFFLFGHLERGTLWLLLNCAF